MSRKQGLSWRVSYDTGTNKLGGKDYITVENAGELDEIVLDDWLHIERMNRRAWWLRIGDAYVWAQIGPDGRATVNITRGEYDGLGGWTTTGGGTVESQPTKFEPVKAEKKAGRK